MQQDVLLKRQKEKKEMLDAVKKFRKGENTLEMYDYSLKFFAAGFVLL